MRSPCLAILLLTATPALAQAPPQAPPKAPPPKPACEAPEHRQFDFWLGEWDAYATGTHYLVGESHIEKMFGDCAVRETWKATQGPGGGSLNHYDAAIGGWRQTWVDGSGAWMEYTGQFEGGQMRLLSKGLNRAGKPVIRRMIFTPNGDGTFRQTIEISTDGSITWTHNTDLTYRRKPPVPR